MSDLQSVKMSPVSSQLLSKYTFLLFTIVVCAVCTLVGFYVTAHVERSDDSSEELVLFSLYMGSRD